MESGGIKCAHSVYKAQPELGSGLLEVTSYILNTFNVDVLTFLS